MKRISFKDSGGLNLTRAVLEGRKTMTRRAVTEQVEKNAMERSSLCSTTYLMRREKLAYILEHSQYKEGDVVAIQQAYKDIPVIALSSSYDCRELRKSAGWANKMFVKAEYMPHHIRITDVSVERLQDISNVDCMREGVQPVWNTTAKPHRVSSYYFDDADYVYTHPSEAFAALIDKVSGRGTWDRNPLVWVYSFVLVD